MNTMEMESELFMSDLRNGAKKACPCCGRYAQIYKRKLHAGMTMQLIKLYRIGGHERFIHVNEMANFFSGTGDMTKFKHWGCIISAENEPDSQTKTSGKWKITSKGVSFILGYIKLPECAYIYDDRLLSFSPQEIGVLDALGNKFSYMELMSA